MKWRYRIHEEKIRWWVLYSVQKRFLWLWWTVFTTPMKYQAENFAKEKGA